MNHLYATQLPVKTAIHNKGFALITTLVLLTMLTILALSQISSNSTQTKIATNATDTETDN